MDAIIHCVGCRGALRVREADLDKAVRCPRCRTLFNAVAEALPAIEPPRPQAGPLEIDEPSAGTYAVQLDDAAATPGRWEGDQPSRGRPRRRPLRLDEEDELDEPDWEPHRGGLVLTLGILSIVLSCIPLAGLILGGIAMSNGSGHRRMMEERLMDPAGLGMTRAGEICGIVGVFLSVVAFIANLFLYFRGLAGLR